MIKVKTFVIKNSNNPLHHERLDGVINNFLAENDIEVVDIKYSTAMTASPTTAAPGPTSKKSSTTNKTIDYEQRLNP